MTKKAIFVLQMSQNGNRDCVRIIFVVSTIDEDETVPIPLVFLWLGWLGVTKRYELKWPVVESLSEIIKLWLEGVSVEWGEAAVTPTTRVDVRLLFIDVSMVLG